MGDWKPGFVGEHRVEDVGRHVSQRTSAPIPCGRCHKLHPMWMDCGILERPGAYLSWSSAKENWSNVRERGRLVDGEIVWEPAALSGS